MARTGDNLVLSAVTLELSAAVARGLSLSQALAMYGRVFPPIFVAMVRAGEEGGSLRRTLTQLADWMERDDRAARRLKATMVYPGFVVALTAALTLALFYCVLPRFVDIFNDMGVTLPVITRGLMEITRAVRNPWAWLAVACLAGAGAAGLRAMRADPGGRLRMQALSFRIPLVGPLLERSTLARWCAMVKLMLGCGVGLVPTLQIAALASGSAVLQADARSLVDAVTRGLTLSQAMQRRPRIYPALLVYMARAGEETGDLGEMFGHAAVFYDLDVATRLEILTASLEPLLLSAITIGVGALVIAIFVPIYGMVRTVGP